MWAKRFLAINMIQLFCFYSITAIIEMLKLNRK